MQIAAQLFIESHENVQIEERPAVLPTVNGLGGYYHINNGDQSVIGNIFNGGNSGPPHDTESDVWQHGISAKLPLDLFGGQRRLIEEAAANAQAAEEVGTT